ncbi:sensor histidine kinase N-terminal domain-containing protein [Martelella lutilitoris]|uniref:histidine kinase n=1 Tax=Martelella lutilitoris TaxID=2583532 RepID=A0A7T7HMN4_9HYPH|nr:sensor histidine kinase N-terminal domain-containing protein [Martelella lutilitoris]QQM32036.1 sensor histidine kinase N-terminal domain-containing protein [Martelella lutilitoris]
MTDGLSIRQRLARLSIEKAVIASAGFVFLLAGALIYNTAYNNAYRAADEAFDRVLGAAALAIADTAAYENGNVIVDIPYSAFAILGTTQMNRIFYRVVAPNGSVVTGSPVLGLDIETPQTPSLRLSDGTMDGEPVRIAAVARYRTDATTGDAGWIDVLVAETRESRNALTSHLIVDSLVPAAAVAVAAFLLMWGGIRLAFRPLRSVARVLRNRARSDLSPISRDVPREIETLVVALNDFMAQLASTLEGLRRVTADAAHQLRTPLAALRAQAEVALDETDARIMRDRVARIHRNAATASTLANRWLTDATLLHKLKMREAETGDLSDYVEEALNRIGSNGEFAEGLRRMEFSRPDQQVLIDADPVGMIEMIRNLIENAFLHAPGPTRVAVTTRRGEAVLTVCDKGSGIALDRREAVFERYVRDRMDRPGSGLGLAIAREVVSAAHGTIELDEADGGGLRVEVRLPIPNASGTDKTPRKPWFRAGWIRFPAFAFLSLATLLPPADLNAQQPEPGLTIVSTLPRDNMSPLLDWIAGRFPSLAINYTSLRPPQIAALVRTPTFGSADIVLLPAPDISVSLSNNGFVRPLADFIASTGPDGRPAHWRNELFEMHSDPAVFVIRKEGTMATGDLPTTRLALARALEQSPSPYYQRIGIVNVGIDSISYLLATQDSLRSALSWRLARDFGSVQARIFETGAELLTALAAGEIDLGYNIPLSSVISAQANGARIDYIEPQDYLLSVPWTIFVPDKSTHPLAAFVAAEILSAEGRAVFASDVLGLAIRADAPGSEQRITLGPELLVFLDTIKRGRFLDNWFQLVTTE